MRHLPPLNALRVFEIAARTSSYAAAAAELGITHGAVSRQIALLESWLGQRLFVRVGRRMAATPAAKAFAEEVSLSFDRITSAADATGQPHAPRILRISAPTTFAMRWLIPRIDQFHASWPEVEVSVMTTTTLHDELRGGFDIAIRRGSAQRDAWPQYTVVGFLGEADTLVMSPALFNDRPVHQSRDLAAHVLLATETRPGDWSNWLDAAGLARMASQRRRVFDHFFVTLQAIFDGLGVGIGPVPVLAGDIAAGRLIAPFPEITVPRTGYVALIPNDADKTPSLQAFVEWLILQSHIV